MEIAMLPAQPNRTNCGKRVRPFLVSLLLGSASSVAVTATGNAACPASPNSGTVNDI